MRLGFKIYNNKKSMGSKGAVYVEFLIVIIPLFIFFLALTQLGLMYASSILVKLAANKAARAAIVILPDDLSGIDYGQDGGSAEASEITDDGINRIAAEDVQGFEAYERASQNGRYRAIRNAARIILSLVSPGLKDVGGHFSFSGSDSSTVHDAVSPATPIVGQGLGIISDIIGGFEGYMYTGAGVSVVFLDTNVEDVTEESRYKTTFGSREKLNVEVNYLFMCRVPVVNTLMCRSFSKLPEHQRALFKATSGNLREVLDFLEGELGDYVFTGRFKILTAQTSLTNQGRKPR